MIDEKKQTPEARAIQARMAKADVTTQSQLHELAGKTVLIGPYTDHNKVVHEGGVATINYAVGERFRATLPNGRQPWGLIADLKTAPDGSLTYDFPEGA